MLLCKYLKPETLKTLIPTLMPFIFLILQSRLRISSFNFYWWVSKNLEDWRWCSIDYFDSPVGMVYL